MANFEQHKTAQPAIAESDSWLFLKYFFSLHTRKKILKIGQIQFYITFLHVHGMQSLAVGNFKTFHLTFIS